MKRSEFLEIVNGVLSEENDLISKEVDRLFSEKQNVDMNDVSGFLVGQITAVAARTTAAIIERCGLVHFEND